MGRFIHKKPEESLLVAQVGCLESDLLEVLSHPSTCVCVRVCVSA